MARWLPNHRRAAGHPNHTRTHPSQFPAEESLWQKVQIAGTGLLGEITFLMPSAGGWRSLWNSLPKASLNPHASPGERMPPPSQTAVVSCHTDFRPWSDKRAACAPRQASGPPGRRHVSRILLGPSASSLCPGFERE